MSSLPPQEGRNFSGKGVSPSGGAFWFGSHLAEFESGVPQRSQRVGEAPAASSHGQPAAFLVKRPEEASCRNLNSPRGKPKYPGHRALLCQLGISIETESIAYMCIYIGRFILKDLAHAVEGRGA